MGTFLRGLRNNPIRLATCRGGRRTNVQDVYRKALMRDARSDMVLTRITQVAFRLERRVARTIAHSHIEGAPFKLCLSGAFLVLPAR